MVITAQDTKLKPGFKETELGVIPEEWNVTILLNITVDGITNGVFNDPTKVGRGYRLINVLDLYHGYNIDTKNLSRLELPLADFAKKKVKKGDLFFTRSSLTPDGIAFCNFCNEEADDITFDGHIMKITPNANIVNSAFLRLYCISKVARKYFISSAKQTTMTTMGQSELAQLPIPLPSLPEQAAIANVFSDTDALIECLEKLIAKKRDIKQATMHQLLTGKTRLPGFSGEWKVRKFGEIFQFLNTANNSRSDLSEDGEIKYIHYGDIHMKWRSFLDCSSDELPLIEKDKVGNVSFLEDGDLVMADASEDYEGIGISVEVKNATGRRVVAGLHTFLLRGDNEVLADGFKGYLQYFPVVKDSLRKAATGISVYGISKHNVKNISICLPDIAEQRAIAAVLSDMDAEIAALEQRRDKTRALKQGMMQELLTGKTRLI